MARESECQPSPGSVSIVVNGETRHVPADSTLLDLVQSLGLDPERVAVELDRRIVRRPDWPLRVLSENAQVEIVQFVGGG